MCQYCVSGDSNTYWMPNMPTIISASLCERWKNTHQYSNSLTCASCKLVTILLLLEMVKSVESSQILVLKPFSWCNSLKINYLHTN